MKRSVRRGAINAASELPDSTAAGLKLDNVSKRYGKTRALHDVSLELPVGTVTAVFGENGAGKSTLLGVLSGLLTPDSGSMILNGHVYKPSEPREALEQGVALVAQELAPCRDLTVAENIVLGSWPARKGMTGKRRMVVRSGELMDRLGITLPLTRPVATVSVAEMQLIEVLRALGRTAKVLLLDEPTAALTANESGALLELIRRLSGEGVIVIMVTHRLGEALSVADQVVVLREGQVVLRKSARDVTSEEVVEAMLNRPLLPADLETPDEGGATASLQLVDCRRGGREPLHDLSMTVKQGEVVACYGVRGSGLETIASVMAGLIRLDQGIIQVGRQRCEKGFRSPAERERCGVRYIPSDRKLTGLAMPLTVRTNLLATRSTALIARKAGVRIRKGEDVVVDRLLAEYGIVGRPAQGVAELSGGNQQKVLMASRLEGDYTTLVVHEPTRGIDIGAREAVHERIRRVAQAGRGVLLISSDVDEIVAVADRVYVMRSGGIAAELTSPGITVDRLLLAASELVGSRG